ncbi:hypothetical protein ACFQ2B_03545 [Streptomyces stramineus]|uniref:FAD-binding domain-containing protein n=1 Tax=Streptomyces stramineus TaxID=173861 RepID=A0ABN1BAU2_9ACTN
MPGAVAYHQDTAAEEVRPEPDGAVLCLAGGREKRFDLVVGADGYRSVVRAATRAAAVARPHAGSGAVKAPQDATALERCLRSAANWTGAAAACDAERAPTGRAVVELGRRLGRARVQSAPDRAALDQRGPEEWWRAAADGERGFGGHALHRP